MVMPPMSKCHELAGQILERRGTASQTLDTFQQQALLALRLFEMPDNAVLELRVVLQALRLAFEHALRLLLHRVGVAEPVQQVLFELCHESPPIVSGEALPYRGWDADQAIPE